MESDTAEYAQEDSSNANAAATDSFETSAFEGNEETHINSMIDSQTDFELESHFDVPEEVQTDADFNADETAETVDTAWDESEEPAVSQDEVSNMVFADAESFSIYKGLLFRMRLIDWWVMQTKLEQRASHKSNVASAGIE